MSLPQEIPGLSKQYDLEFFRGLEQQRGIRLENIVYYKDLTHYFVMTAKIDSLLQKQVIKVWKSIEQKNVQTLLSKEATDCRENLLHPSNIDQEALEQYAIDAAQFSTEHFSVPLPTTNFAKCKGRITSIRH